MASQVVSSSIAWCPMQMRKSRQDFIDGLTLIQLLERWRFAKPGDRWMSGETGDYWKKRMTELRTRNPAEWVRASKTLGWDRRD